MRKNAFLFLALSALTAATAPALPGIAPYIPDTSGEYIYYRDFSAEPPVLVGFLYYDEGTYAARYYSPANARTFTPEKDITAYFSVNPDSEFIELTGESITGAETPQDALLVNHLHDIFYELCARRRKVNVSGIQDKVSKENYEQLGGQVSITWSPLVPIFNMLSIKDPKGKPLMLLETAGTLTSSDDTSFAWYKGFPTLPKDKIHTLKKSPDARIPQTADFNGCTASLDGMWRRAADNIWLLGDSALLTMGLIQIPAEFLEQGTDSAAFLQRRLSQSTANSYALWERRKITRTENSFTVENIFWQPQSQNVTHKFSVITRRQDGDYDSMELTVFEGAYAQNKKYFNGILASYKTDN